MALRRSLAQLVLSLRPIVYPRLSNCVEIGPAVQSACRPPAALHRCSAAFTSLRLFGTRQDSSRSPQAQERRPSSRDYTTATSPDQHALANAAGASAPGDVVAGQTLEEIRSRIFGTHIGNGLRSGRKVLRGQLLGARIAAYYPEDPRQGDPLMLSLKAERAKAKLDRMRRRGKAPPKKGAGKRSKK